MAHDTETESTIDRDDVTELRAEADKAGDSNQVAICDRALAGDDDAWAECERAIDYARAHN